MEECWGGGGAFPPWGPEILRVGVREAQCWAVLSSLIKALHHPPPGLEKAAPHPLLLEEHQHTGSQDSRSGECPSCHQSFGRGVLLCRQARGGGGGGREGRAGVSVMCCNSLHPTAVLAEQGDTRNPGCSPIDSQVSLQPAIAGPQSEKVLEASPPTGEVLSSAGTEMYLRLCRKLGLGFPADQTSDLGLCKPVLEPGCVYSLGHLHTWKVCSFEWLLGFSGDIGSDICPLPPLHQELLVWRKWGLHRGRISSEALSTRMLAWGSAHLSAC